MKSFPSHAKRILLYMIMVGMLPVMLMSLDNYFFSKKAVEDSEQGHLGYALKSRMAFLEAWLHHTKKEFHYSAKSSCSIQDCAGHFENKKQKNATCKSLQSVMRGHATYLSLAVYDNKWSLLVTTTESKEVDIAPPSENLTELFEKATGFTAGPIYFVENRAILPLCQPTLDDKGKPQSYTVGYLDIQQSLNRILGEASDIGETGNFFLLGKDGTYLWAPKTMKLLIGTKAKIPQALFSEQSKVTHYKNEENIKVLGIAAQVDHIVPWTLLAQIEEHEAYQVVKQRMLISLLTCLVTLALIAYICIRLSNRLSTPLKELARVAHNISSGNMKERVPEFSEQETRELAIAFNRMLDRLAASQKALARSASLAAVGELSSSIVHEMRSPLSSMKINLQSLGQKLSDDPVYAEVADISIQQADRLETMLSNLMNYGSPLDLKIEQVTFGKLVTNVLHVLGEKAKAKNISIQIKDELNNKPIQIDLELMTQALTNLVGNAVQWSPEGGVVTITAAIAPGEGDWISIRVKDDGPGFKDSQKKKLFKLFYSTRDTGHGIGLANVKKIIEYHDGLVSGENAEEGGAVFSILMPIGGSEN